MSGSQRAKGHVVHADLNDGTLFTSTSTSSPVLILSTADRYQFVFIENRSTGTFDLTSSTESTAVGIPFSSGATLLFGSVVPKNKLYANPTSTALFTAMVQTAV